jgi:nucleotide-binding universal stress UspA family protein
MRVLILTDFSDGANRALQFVRKHFPDAETRLLHVVDVAGLHKMSASSHSKLGHTALEVQQDLTAEAEQKLVELGGGVVRYGHPAEVALEEADAWNADLIAMGTAGKKGLERLIMGSVAEQVVRQAPIPVLIVGDNDRI